MGAFDTENAEGKLTTLKGFKGFDCILSAFFSTFSASSDSKEHRHFEVWFGGGGFED